MSPERLTNISLAWIAPKTISSPDSVNLNQWLMELGIQQVSQRKAETGGRGMPQDRKEWP